MKIRINDQERIAIKENGERIPVRDAKFSFLLTPNQEDIDKGIPGDAANCAFARACRRLHGSELVWVTRGLAYIELRGKNGAKILYRFILKDPAKKFIKGYDQTKDALFPESVIFAAPTGKRTLNAQRAAAKEWYDRQREAGANPSKRPHRKAHVVGELKGEIVRPPSKTPLTLRERQSGMFRFTRRS
jgi:hypothetical protein